MGLSGREISEELTREDIAKKPWKYVGYKEFSKFIVSDNDFFVLRHFRALSAQALLALQDQLAWSEEDLGLIDLEARHRNSPDIHNGSFRQEVHPKRRQLIQKSNRTLQDYS